MNTDKEIKVGDIFKYKNSYILVIGIVTDIEMDEQGFKIYTFKTLKEETRNGRNSRGMILQAFWEGSDMYKKLKILSRDEALLELI